MQNIVKNEIIVVYLHHMLYLINNYAFAHVYTQFQHVQVHIYKLANSSMTGEHSTADNGTFMSTGASPSHFSSAGAFASHERQSARTRGKKMDSVSWRFVVWRMLILGRIIWLGTKCKWSPHVGIPKVCGILSDNFCCSIIRPNWRRRNHEPTP